MSRALLNPQVSTYVAVGGTVERVAREFVGGARLVRLRSFVDPLPSADAERPAFLPDGEFILFVGSLIEDKGSKVLIDAYTALVAKRAMPPLVILGKPSSEMRAELPAGVIVRYNVPAGEVRAAWRHALIGVVPSTYMDPFPHAAIECQLAGRPTIASRTGGLPEIVEDGVSGILVEPGNAADLRNALTRLLDNPELREEMGARARDRSDAMTTGPVVTELLAVFDQTIAQYRAQARR